MAEKQVKASTEKTEDAKAKATESNAKDGETTETEPTGLAATGNGVDMSTPYEDPAGSSVSANVEHQEGAPPAMVEAVEESERLGYIAPEQNALKPSKPDYTQRNPEVMNQGSEG